MPNLPEPTTLQQWDRTDHSTSSGIEIIRTFYCEPYSSYPSVKQALQGTVTVDDAGVWTRTRPARDTYIPNCYCNEVTADFVDKRAITSSHSMELPGRNLKEMLEGAVADEPDDNNRIRETTELGVAGALIKAHYRPLITAWTRTDGSEPDELPRFVPEDDEWDWMDLKRVPRIRQIQWPEGLFITARDFVGLPFNENIPDSASSPLGLVIEDISIRRILVGEIPQDVIDQCANCVNREVFPAADSNARPGFPTCPARTLKFVGADTLNMMDAQGHRWYELTLNFRRIVHWSNAVVTAAAHFEDNWVTWNHVFMRPGLSPVGWYPVWLSADRRPLGVAIPSIVDDLRLRAGPLHNEADFALLFKLNP